jgi:hypothetical protein
MANMSPRTSAVDVASQCKLSERARSLLKGDPTPVEYFGRLERERLYRDGIRFVAHFLPRRDAIWWGCLCVWQAYRTGQSPKEKAALQAVITWLQEPDEGRRREAESAALAAGPDTPAGLLALAVFCSEGSLSGPGLPAVPPPAGLSTRTVADAVLLASNLGNPSDSPQFLRQCLVFASDVATGRSVCPRGPVNN